MSITRIISHLRLLVAGLVAACLLSGCITNTVKQQRVARYNPSTFGRRPWEWMQDKNKPDAGQEQKPAPAVKRVLKVGDMLTIYLRAIPVPDKIEAVINALGEVNFPHIGLIRVNGMTTAGAEKKVEKAYVDKGIYKSISVIVVPQLDEYFVTGEVQRPGKYPFSGEVTLMQTIAAAGGYTDFANTRRIEVRRKATGKTEKYDARAISRDQEKDPTIEPGDIIKVIEHW